MEEGRMGKIIEDYFGTSFTTSDPSGFDEILCRIQPSITDEMNATLTSEFTTEEVHQALKQMAPTTRGGNSCSRVGFVSCQVMSIRLHRSTLTRHVY